MRGGRREGAGRKKKPDHLKRELVTIRLPQWMISQLKSKGEIGYLIEYQLAKKDFLNLPVTTGLLPSHFFRYRILPLPFFSFSSIEIFQLYIL